MRRVVMMIISCAMVFSLLSAQAKQEGPQPDAPTNIFKDRLGPAPAEGAFRMDDYIVWGGSVTKGDDGKYYMFASRWPKSVGLGNCVVNSEVVLASSEKAEGPIHLEVE